MATVGYPESEHTHTEADRGCPLLEGAACNTAHTYWYKIGRLACTETNGDMGYGI